MAGKQDRRRSERSRLAALATIKTQGFAMQNDQAFSAVMDVSRHGVRLRTGQPPEPGDWVRLRLGIGEAIVSIEGVTRRVERIGKAFDVGIEWVNCTPQQLEFLDQYLVGDSAPKT